MQFIRSLNNVFSKIAYCTILVSLFSSSLYGQTTVRGADIGWLSEMEQSGRKWRDSTGVQRDVLDILDDYCIDAIRLRVWVNPSGGWCGKQDVVAMAKRAYVKGYKIMIDFHYSDIWADPGQQTKPVAWASYSLTQLRQAVYDHTYDVLQALKTENITPQWVQVGNETNNGMLWPEGQASTNMANYAAFINRGYDAVKAVFPNAKVIVHVANAFDNALFRWNIGGLVTNGAKFDVIGMSMYPETAADWSNYSAQALTNMQDMISRYSKEIMVSEIGLETSLPTEGRKFVETVIQNLQALPSNKGLGVFWWEPAAYDWRGYGKVAWYGNYGTKPYQPTDAMNGFKYKCSVVPKPVISITSPAANALFCSGNSITVNVSASIVSGSISKVDLYNESTLLQTDNTAPYSFTLDNITSGTKTLRAIATANNNTTTQSTDVTVLVNSKPAMPTVNPTITYTINDNPLPLTANGTSLKWYDSSTGGNTSNTAPKPDNTNIGVIQYYVSQTINLCESDRSVITVKIIYPIVKLKKGWNLIACPLKGSFPLQTKLSSILQYVETIKNFDSFYSPNNNPALNSLLNVEWGKGYMIKMVADCDLDWGL